MIVKKLFFMGLLLSGVLLFAQDKPETEAAPENPPAASLEETQHNTIKYGTETEIAALIETLKTDGADYLDNEIISLVENTRNQRILGGAFSFFGDREKGGLESRAMRAIEERDDEENETVLAAIDYLGKVKDGNALPVLRDLLESDEARFMNAAFRAYGRISGSGSADADAGEAAEYLIDFYENREPADENRREMITALGAAGSAKAVEFLANIASDNEARTTLRVAALESITKIGDEGGLDAVLACVSAKDPNIRSAAVAALGPFSGKAVDDAIFDAFRDSFYRTRIAAAQASRQRKLSAAVPYLQFRAERDEVPAVKEEAIRALGAIADAESIKILEKLFSDRKSSDRVRLAAAEMLMQNQPEKVLDSFIKEMDEAQKKNQKALYNGFIRIIGKTKSANMEEIARRLIQQSGAVEKSTALDIAANNNLAALREEIKAVTADKNESLASKAKRTLEKLGLAE